MYFFYVIISYIVRFYIHINICIYVYIVFRCMSRWVDAKGLTGVALLFAIRLISHVRLYRCTFRWGFGLGMLCHGLVPTTTSVNILQ